MRNIRVIAVSGLFSMALLCSSFRAAEQQPLKWILLKGGSLSVKGKTNVNEFTCSITGYSNADTILVSRKADNLPVVLKGELALPVSLFNCKNPIMTSDLRKTLKAKQYPELSIRFLTLSRLPAEGTKDAVKGLVEIELAGKTRRYEINYQINNNQSSVNLLGERNINFTDFGLSPPSKLGGMIRTENQLSVQFKLNMAQKN